MNPPSAELQRTLDALGLASAGEIARSRRAVRNLARGLPVYDSVWIDALVQQGALTAYQGRLIEARRGAELRVAENVALRAPRHLDPVLSVYSARQTETGSPLLVSRIRVFDGDVAGAEGRLRHTMARLRADGTPDAPIAVVSQNDCVSVIAPYRQGESLQSLLVRRGRLPHPVVQAVLEDLIAQLAAGDLTLPHGDIRLANIWLSPQGQVQLHHWGLLAAVIPQISIHAKLPADAADTLAPERLSAGRPAGCASDLYSLGCVLWHLLTGRPPYTMAEPLAKLMAHQTRQIADVRVLAPETPPLLADLIQKLTAKEPHRRPQTYLEVQKLLQRGVRHGPIRLKQFARSFESAAPHRAAAAPRTRSRIPSTAMAAMTLVAIGLAAWNRDSLGLPVLMRVSAAISPEKQTPPVPQALADSDSTSGWQKLPEPDENGIVTLLPGGAYRAGALQHPARLTLRGDLENPPTIFLADQPLALQAPQVSLEQVRLLRQGNEARRGPVRIQAHDVVVDRCWIDFSGPGTPSVNTIDWTSLEPGDLHPVGLLITDSVLIDAGFEIQPPLRSVLLEHVYKAGANALLRLRSAAQSGFKVPLVANNCTLHASGSLAMVESSDETRTPGLLSIQGRDTILDLAPGEAALAMGQGMTDAGLERHIEIAAQGLIVRPDVILFGRRADEQSPPTPIDSHRLKVDGVLSGEFHFEPDAARSSVLMRPVVDRLPVHLSSSAPGADPTRLPGHDSVSQAQEQSGANRL